MFNVTKVCKELRGSGTLIWYKSKEFDYVANGYFAIKLNLNNYRKILGTLVEIFGVVPKVNQTLNFTKVVCKKIDIGSVKEMKKHEFVDWIDKREVEEIGYTGLFHKEFNKLLGIFKGEDYIYIDTKYLDLIKDNYVVKCEGNERLTPIFVTHNKEAIMIMPVRVCEDNKFLVKEKDLSRGN
ncbi:hypothetical protein [Tissierella praeacuta]|uniref:hypothetical protein n=1 Tax=Tissierella praeacuta TaxID=43131 RepID=UPI0033400AD5